MMSTRNVAADYPPGADRTLLAFALTQAYRNLADDADQQELEYLARAVTNLANDLVFAASEAGAAQRERLAAAPFPRSRRPMFHAA